MFMRVWWWGCKINLVTCLQAWFSVVVKVNKPMTLQQFARLGGIARSKSLTKSERKTIARRAALVRWGRKANV